MAFHKLSMGVRVGGGGQYRHPSTAVNGQAQVPITLSRTHAIGLASLEELLLGILTDGFQEPIAHLYRVAERLVDQHWRQPMPDHPGQSQRRRALSTPVETA